MHYEVSFSFLRAHIRNLGTLTTQPEISNVTPKSQVMKRNTTSDHDTTPCLGNSSSHNITSKSRALVTSPNLSMEALAVVPYHRKLGSPEFVRRRIRRPFTVSEVEALVKAVEKLGTGRSGSKLLSLFGLVIAWA